MRRFFTFVFVGVAIAMLWPSAASAEAHLPESILEFFENNCYDCHSVDRAKGELDLESLAFQPKDHADLKRWNLVYDRVKHHEMPPKGEADGRDIFLKEFETLLHDTSEAHQTAKGRVRSRRLNRLEFENTVHALLGIDLPISQQLPEDPTRDGFNNVAESQPVSYDLLEKYMDVVDLSLEATSIAAGSSPKAAFSKSRSTARPPRRLFEACGC